MAKVTLREALFNDEDLSGIWGVLRQAIAVPYGECSLFNFARMYQHKYVDNPARTARHSFGWLLESSKDGIVGFIGMVPIRMNIGNKDITGACGTSHGVLPAYRAYSISLYKQFMSWGKDHFLVDTTSGQAGNKLHTHLKLGMTKLPVANLDQAYLWLIRPEIPAKWLLDKKTKQNGLWGPIGTPYAWLLKALARARYAGHRSLRFPSATLLVEPVKVFTDDFTQFWHDHKMMYGNTTVRDRTYLQWRHLEVPPIVSTTHVFACRDGGRLMGYLTLLERHQLEGYCPGHFRVTDVFYDRSRPDAMFSLMNHAFEFARSQGGSIFEISKISPELQEMLYSQKPYVRQQEAWPYWYRAPTKDLADACLREVWWPSGSDGDSNV